MFMIQFRYTPPLSLLRLLLLLTGALPVVLLGSTSATAQVAWVNAVNGNNEDRGEDIAIDDFGNSYVTGFFSDSPDFDGDGQADVQSTGDYDMFVAKYDANGAFQWVSTAGGSSGRDAGVGVAVDDAGFVYVTGYFNDSADFDGDGQADVTSVGGTTDDDVFVAKYDGTGALQWVRSGGSSFSPESGEGIAVTNAGDVLVAGSITGDADFSGDGQADITAQGAGDIFVAKFDASGAFQWANGGGGFLIDEGLGVDVDGAGFAYVTGSFTGSADLDGDGQTDVRAGGSFAINGFVAKYDPNGSLIWANATGGSMPAFGQDIAVSGAGTSTVTGSFQGDADFSGNGQTDVSSAGSGDVFVARYGADGSLVWVQRAGGTSFDEGFSAAVDDAGNAYATGYFAGDADFDGDGQADVSSAFIDVFVVKYDAASGTFQGIQQAGKEAGGDTADRGRGIAADAAGNAYVTGGFRTDADFDGDGQPDLTSTDGTDVFVVRYQATALPVELAGFTATADNGRVSLRWQTVTETGNAGFDVQRLAGDGGVWKTLGRVEGAGTTTVPQNYRYTDTALPYEAESLRYRLRQIDLDGTVAFSDERAIALAGPNQLELRGTFPNPVRSHAIVRVGIPEKAGRTRLTLYDLLGRPLRTVVIPRAGRQEVRLPTGTLPSGMYFLRLSGNGQNRTQKITVIR
jgi:hypothetical protein